MAPIRRLALLAVLAATPLAGACAAHHPSRVVYVYVPTPPPPVVRETIVRSPGPGYVWVAGHHRWDGRAYVWVPGRWERPPVHRAHWVSGHWSHDRRGWYYVEGHWS